MQQPSVRFTVVAGANDSPHSHADSSIQTWLNNRTISDDVLGFADRHRWWLWLTLIAFYLAAFNGQWRIQPDAALYLSIGRNLAHGQGFTYLGEPERLAHPGWPAVIALTFKTFGGKSLLPVNAVMLLISLATVSAVYRLFLIFAGRPTAVVVALGAGLTKAFFCYAFELWSDMPFALGVMCALAGFEGLSVNYYRTEERKRSAGQLLLDTIFLLGGLMIAASMRPTIWPLLAAVVLASLLRAIRRKSISWAIPAIIAGLVAVIGLGSMFGWSRTSFHGFGIEYGEFLINRLSGHDSGKVTHSLWENIHDLFAWAASDVLFQTRLGPFCNGLLSLLVVCLGVGLYRYRLLWGLWFCLLLPTILISQATLDRYFLPVLPLLVYAWWDLLAEINRRLPKPWANLAFLGLVSFGGLMNVTKICGIIAQQRETPFLAHYDQGTYDGTLAFAAKLHDTVGNRAIVFVAKPYGRVLAYLSERFVTGPVGITPAQLVNHRVFVAEPGDKDIQELLRAAGLKEGPALFTVNPSASHGPLATSLSLHSTFHP
jgi:hypothetical protein